MKRIILSAFLLLMAASAFAQADTVRLQDKRLLTNELKPGLNQYLVYFQMGKSKKTLSFWYWLRDIKVQNRNGEKVFVIDQHWFGSDTNAYRTVYSINRYADFAPVYHKEVRRGKVFAYNWDDKKITGADTVGDNSQKAFSLNFTLPNFNWNLDIETFAMLPLAEGKAFAINFYDAGLDPPAYVVYKVTGSEVIDTYDSHKVDCWKLFTEGTSQGKPYTETYWISKKGHEFLKEEDTFGGGYRYKVKMPASVTDLMSRFDK